MSFDKLQKIAAFDTFYTQVIETLEQRTAISNIEVFHPTAKDLERTKVITFLLGEDNAVIKLIVDEKACSLQYTLFVRGKEYIRTNFLNGVSPLVTELDKLLGLEVSAQNSGFTPKYHLTYFNKSKQQLELLGPCETLDEIKNDLIQFEEWGILQAIKEYEEQYVISQNTQVMTNNDNFCLTYSLYD